MKKTILISLTLFILASTISVQAASRFCAAGSKEQTKCAAWAIALGSNNLTCVNGKDEVDCYTKIAMKQADMGVFDGGKIYDAGKKYKGGLVVIAYEHRTSSPSTYTNYYAVAVVRKGSNLTLNTLKGSKSCHTAYGRTSGWKVPIGYLLSSKKMSWVDCDQAKSAAGFFSQSCVPGVQSQKNKLCALCNGTGVNKCALNSNEPYYSYAGAFKCLTQKAGDVAFIKASIVLAATTPTNYMLLCKDNTQKAPAAYKTCNLAKAPAHAILARKDDPNLASLVALLKTSSAKFGSTNKNFTLFDGNIFSSSAASLNEVAANHQPYDKYLDTSYMTDVGKLNSCKKKPASISPAVTTGIPMLVITSLFMVILAKMMM